ncbi:MAG: hypothetical protein ABIA93_06020 [Candidatus Woesearchaeota archaeon]
MKILIALTFVSLFVLVACQPENVTVLNPPKEPNGPTDSMINETNSSSVTPEVENSVSPSEIKAKRAKLLENTPNHVAKYSYSIKSPQGTQSGYETMAVRNKDFKDYRVFTVNNTQVWQSTFILGGTFIICQKDDPDLCYQYPKQDNLPEVPGFGESLANVTVAFADKPASLKLDAQCFAINPHLSAFVQIECYTNDGIFAYERIEGDSFTQEVIATSIELGTFNDEFELPAEVITVPDSWLQQS